MATYKSETLHRTYQGRVRPRAHYTLGRLRKNVQTTEKPEGKKGVLRVDSFTDSLSPEITLHAITVLEAAGCDVTITDPGVCCGLTVVSTGQLTAAKQKLTNAVEVVHPVCYSRLHGGRAGAQLCRD